MSDILPTMLQHATTAMQHSYSPYSHYRVGACLLAEDGQLYSGCNVENCSYGLCICAEASAISTMASNGCRQIKELLVIASGEKLCTPCGACRQRILEFADDDTLIHLANNAGIQQSIPLSQLLPYAFSPQCLDEENR